VIVGEVWERKSYEREEEGRDCIKRCCISREGISRNRRTIKDAAHIDNLSTLVQRRKSGLAASVPGFE